VAIAGLDVSGRVFVRRFIADGHYVRSTQNPKSDERRRIDHALQYGWRSHRPVTSGFVFLPSVGFQSSLIIAAASYIGLAILAMERPSWSFHLPSGKLFLLLGLVFLLVIAFFPYHRADLHFANARRPL